MISKTSMIAVVLLFIMGFGLTVGVNIWYTNAEAKHSCQALELLTGSKIKFSPQFRSALVYWEHSDHC